MHSVSSYLFGVGLVACAMLSLGTVSPETPALLVGATPSTPPAATEICNNGIDDDGDGLIDCADCVDCAAAAACGDNDGDGVGDYCDLDDDNDGIPDADECPGFAYGPELVTNGDFEDGYARWTSFFNRGKNNNGPSREGCSEQGWVALTRCATRQGLCAAYFDYGGSEPTGSVLITDPIGTGANVVNTTACTYDNIGCMPEILPDHTSGSGLSLYIDPSDVPGRAYWRSTVTVAPNTSYEFSAWLMVIEEDPNLVFTIDGADIGPAFNLDRQTGGYQGPDAWQRVHVEWFSGATGGPVTIELVNVTAGCSGNDIRIDDISLRARSAGCDADRDGITNDLDLDSDNDGLYDLVEAGHGAADADGDGVVDGAAAAFGANGLLDALETAPDNGVLAYAIADSDSAPNGTYDAYTLDADGDGCFDTVEEGVSDPEEDGTAGAGTPSVQTDGLIVGHTYTGPTRSQWQAFAVKSCAGEVCNDGIDNDGNGDADCADVACPCVDNCDAASSGLLDTDGDGVVDACDLDDDNDGIPDFDESICEGFSANVAAWTHNYFPSAPGRALDPKYVAAVQDIAFGPGLDAYFAASQVGMPGLDQPNLTAAVADGDYLEYGFATASPADAFFFTEFGFTKHGGGSSGTPERYGYDFTVRMSDDDFATYATVVDFFHVDTDLPPNFATVYFGRDTRNYLALNGTDYKIRVYFYNKTTDASVAAWFDDFAIRTNVCRLTGDVDGDGVPNHLDLDSDNDGITDLVEADHNRADANDDGVLDGTAAAFGANGLLDALETVPDNGERNYFIRNSEAAWDPVYDAYTLDSDGDGCFDTEEARVSDADDDGLAGAGTPSVDGAGLVAGHSYPRPPNRQWQDWRRGVCLPEICDNAIDDDADGLTDCDDEDCPKGDPVARVTVGN